MTKVCGFCQAAGRGNWEDAAKFCGCANCGCGDPEPTPEPEDCSTFPWEPYYCDTCLASPGNCVCPPVPVPASEKYRAYEYVIRADDPGWSTESLPYYSTSMVHPSDAWGIDGWIPVEFPRLLLSGDYVGDSVTESNRRVFLEEYSAIPGVYEFSEGYGARGVLLTPWALAWVLEGDPVMDYGIDTRPVSQYGPEYRRFTIKTLRDVLSKLEDYPALDEEAIYEVEREREDEAWDSWTRADLERELTRRFPACEDIFEHREVLRRDFEVWADMAGVYWAHETGNSCYIDLERIVKALTVRDLVDAGYGLIEEHAAARLVSGENL